MKKDLKNQQFIMKINLKKPSYVNKSPSASNQNNKKVANGMLFGLAHRAVNNATTKIGQSFSELMDTLKKFSTEII